MLSQRCEWNLARSVTAALAIAVLMLLVASTPLRSAAGVPTDVPAQSKAIAGIHKVEPLVLQDTANGKSGSFIVLLEEQADLRAAYAIKDHDQRGWYVLNTLRDHAARTQTGVKASLDSLGVSYRSFWAANAIAVTGDRALVEALAARADVGKIEADRPSRAVNPMKEPAADGASSPMAVEWGVQNVNAPQVWAMGFTGQGIVVGNQDTGMRWTHLAIKNQYRGWNGTSANHNHNWWDAIHATDPSNVCGADSAQPCDDDDLLGGGHGTHTTGTSVGDDGTGNQVGVAPGAKWIGCRNMDRGVGRPPTYLECFQFFLAPHDLSKRNLDPTKRPHVMNNSWVCLEGCAPDTLRAAIENSRASGIFVEASAGNDGPGCSTVAATPAMYEMVFSTGAYNISNTLARFSSLGPVVSDGSNRIKPNISAPGVNVRSALRGSDTEYGNLSGTSMAGPHVVGVVALLWSARPELVRQIDETETMLERSANPNVTPYLAAEPYCGLTPPTQIPNNYFGWGRVDTLAAVQLAAAGCQTGSRYTVTESTGATIDPKGSVVPGSQCDDCVVNIEIPFPVRFYGAQFTAINASSNGNLQFASKNTTNLPVCLPSAAFNHALMAYWRDLDLRSSTMPTNGIYTSVTGTAPNRVFNIEWKGCIYEGVLCSRQVNFEARLYEGQERFDVVYGAMNTDNRPATVGAQRNRGSSVTLYSCAARPYATGLKLTFNLQCPTQ